MKKYELIYSSEAQMLRVVFLEYLGNDDIQEFGQAIEELLDGKKALKVIGDFTPLRGKKIEVLTKPAREFIVQLGDRYDIKRVAVFGVPIIFRTIIQGIMALMKSELDLEYDFFATNEEAVRWLITDREDV